MDDNNGKNINNECGMGYSAKYSNVCPFCEKRCEDVDPEMCKAMGKAYEQGYDNAFTG